MTTLSDSAWRPSIELAVLPPATPARAAPADGQGGATDDGFMLFGEDGFTFLDFIDIINPLHHIPVIGTLYRHFSGDEIDPGSRVFGGTLFFGPLGTVASIGDVLIRDATGKDLGQHVMAMLDQPASQPSDVAAAGSTIVAVANINASDAAAADARESEALDPVTQWAMEEVAFRQAAATKTRASTESRPDLRERASMPMPAIVAAYDNSRQALITSGLAAPAPQTSVAAMPARLRADAAGDAKAQSIIRHTKRSAAMLAAAGYGHVDPAAERRNNEQPGAASPGASLATLLGTPPGTPPGAVAPLGGWFSEAMLEAHGRYQAAAVAARERYPTTLDVRH